MSPDLDAIAAAQGFSGVVQVDDGAGSLVERAYGFADRAAEIANTTSTRFAVASGSKGFTALVVLSLVGEGALALDTTARSLLGDDLPLVADDVTIQHLLGHTSGIGDYIDEELGGEITDRAIPGSMSDLATTPAFLPLLDGFPTKFRAGERFEYCNGGFVVLAVLAERASGGTAYVDLVRERVLVPAGMAETDFLRSDELPGGVARNYLYEDPASLRTNVFHLPVVGSGDGGAFTTLADMARFWRALHAGAIVDPDTVAEATRPHSEVAEDGRTYGLGFWLEPAKGVVELVGYDAGVSFRSRIQPATGAITTVIGNTSEGAWSFFRAMST